jgi:protein TonB
MRVAVRLFAAVVVLAGASAASAQATAPASGDAPGQGGPPPTARYYPERAARMNMAGSARMKCLVTAEGRLQNCEILSESPEGYGFGQAALNMATLFKMRPQTRDGQPVGGATVVIPLKFNPPSDPPPPPAAPKP